MELGMIALILLGIGTLGCVLWSANTGNKTHKIITEVMACVSIFALCTIIGCTATLSEQDTTDAAHLKTPEATQNKTDVSLAEAELEVSKIKVEAAKNEAEAKKIAAEGEAEANRIIAESLTYEVLAKLLIEKWNGELPEVVDLGEYVLPTNIATTKEGYDIDLECIQP